MTQLVLWMIMAYGLSNIVVYGSIFNGPRNTINRWATNEFTPFNGFWVFISNMIKCMMCFGFHCGWFLSLLVYSPVHELLGTNQYYSWFFDGMLASGSVWAINAIIEWFEENRPSNRK
jgi:hypothetical protein